MGGPVRKIVTCCYCGARAALVLGGRTGRHELACATCGAPLRKLKMLPVAAVRPAPAPPRPGKRRRKPWLRDWLEEVWDDLEDLFD